MVYYFESCWSHPAATEKLLLYCGKDKYENEDLIAYGWPEDIWFHVDDLSSAHVYLRLPRGPLRMRYRETGTLSHLPEVVRECCALVKTNSIEGSKKSRVDVVYTSWENLKKTSAMATGEIGFHDPTKVVKVHDVVRDRDIVKALEKTKYEAFPDLAGLRQQRDDDVRAKQKERHRQLQKQRTIDADHLRVEKEARSYDRLFQNIPTSTFPDATIDQSAALKAEDDFM